MTTALEKVTVVIRSVGERTEAVCRQLILEQGVAEDAVFVIREAPFSQAMRVGFQIGLKQGRPWTFCVDADLLLRPGSIQRMVELAEQQPENVCEIQGYILDKFFGGPRIGGIHLYRTALLDRVIAAIPAEGVNIRPERATLGHMEKQGFPFVVVPELVGLHDFEQYQADIFRKCFVQAHKHLYLAPLLVEYWRESAAGDADYEVALAGFARGIDHCGDVRVDVREQLFSHSSEALGVCEKAQILPDEWSLERVESLITDWHEPELYHRYFPRRAGLEPAAQTHATTGTTHKRLKGWWRRVVEIGSWRVLPYGIGWLLQRLGQILQQSVKV